MPEDRFGEQIANEYDSSDDEEFRPEVIAATVAFLAELAGDRGPALELAIGTGRVGVPLSARGVEVHGIDLSEAMVDRLRAKADHIPVTIGDIATTRVGSGFRLAYLVFNTIMNLTTQAEQVACFRNASAHLEPGGHFVVEVMVPDLQRLPRGEVFRPFSVTAKHIGIDEYDVVHQGLISHHYALEGGAWTQVAMPFRYVWPAELDLMAELAGMERIERWGDWDRSPFTAESPKHVSVWRKV